MKTITLPLEYFLEILLSAPPSYIPVRSRSMLEGAQDIPPALCRYEIGILLRELDKEEEHVKVFLYEDTRHAEVWDVRTWLNSTTHYWQAKKEQSASSQEILQREEKFKEYTLQVERIFQILNEYLPKDSARYFAQRLAASDKWDQVKEIIEKTFKQ